MLRQAQEQTRLLYELERTMNANRDYLTKVRYEPNLSLCASKLTVDLSPCQAVKHKEEAGWGAEEDVYPSGGGGGWVEDSVM